MTHLWHYVSSFRRSNLILRLCLIHLVSNIEKYKYRMKFITLKTVVRCDYYLSFVVVILFEWRYYIVTECPRHSSWESLLRQTTDWIWHVTGNGRLYISFLLMQRDLYTGTKPCLNCRMSWRKEIETFKVRNVGSNRYGDVSRKGDYLEGHRFFVLIGYVPRVSSTIWLKCERTGVYITLLTILYFSPLGFLNGRNNILFL